jgi:hypothetical protein
MTGKDILNGRHNTLLEGLYTLFTWNGHAPRILLPSRCNLWKVRTHLFKGHSGDGAAIILLQTVILREIQAEMPTYDLGSLARPQQWAGVQSTQVLFMSQAMCQGKGLLSTDLGQWLIVQTLNSPGSVADRLSVSYQD